MIALQALEENPQTRLAYHHQKNATNKGSEFLLLDPSSSLVMPTRVTDCPTYRYVYASNIGCTKLGSVRRYALVSFLANMTS